ncbi:hypothetical protein FRACYDRAFT_264671 [Fragilariopsis cylindrus CCMP1102]|uniref:Uncharacterized protein n=1 Tax=Fragilariopsis cylindrus CCMP1102 TaxID=635003 RepID=A0A1E7EQN5_9STRA|nr:hypothetical protein FRACYDRAFT_264671 [Fragilariopsis cylindrus CCMP1102]|eukprot:OEU08320.1 hypothetical protein FRACYDRAFT_264671 [Fragilariopsis cylindrus CCMP1102]
MDPNVNAFFSFLDLVAGIGGSKTRPVANKEDSTDSDLRATVAWLADLEILYALGCSSETTLVHKISEAILSAPARCRVTMYCPAAGGPPGDGTIFPTMTEAFTEFKNSLVCTEDGCENEHRVGGDYRNNTCWDIQEAEYVNDEAKVNQPNKNLQLLPVLQQKKKDEAKEAKEWLQLKNDEFWVTMWKTDPLHSCELRLIGVGPRY